MTRRLALLAIAGLLIGSFVLRRSTLSQLTGAPSLEASYHALLTIESLRELKPSEHYFLPAVSLGRPADRGIPWGETIPTKEGVYVYTSFPPPGFLAPYVALGVVGAAPTLRALTIFNWCLQTVVCLFLYLLLELLLRSSGIAESAARMGAVAGVSLQIFSSEALLSYGLVYWSQQLSQVFLLGALLMLGETLLRQGPDRRWFMAGLLLAVFLGAWTEWTGFLTAMGIAGLLVVLGFRERSLWLLSFRVLLATSLAGLAILLHYAAAAGVAPTFDAFVHRFFARSASKGHFSELREGYLESFGFLPPLAAGLFFWAWWQGRRANASATATRVALLVFIASLVPLAENVVLLQHATQFSYDRLKVLVPLAIIVAFAIARLSGWSRLTGVGLLALALFQNVTLYEGRLVPFQSWATVDEENQRLVAKVQATVDQGCTLYASNIGVRGYPTLLVHRGIYQYLTRWQEIQPLMRERKACASVFLAGYDAFPDLPRYTRALILRSPDAKPEEILATEGRRKQE